MTPPSARPRLVRAPESEGFYAGGTDLFASGALDRQVWERLYRRLQIAAERLGETRAGWSTSTSAATT
jgi:hypothetical protein